MDETIGVEFLRTATGGATVTAEMTSWSLWKRPVSRAYNLYLGLTVHVIHQRVAILLIMYFSGFLDENFCGKFWHNIFS